MTLSQDDCYLKLKFKDSQLTALKEIYNKYFLPKINQQYNGKAFIFMWREGSTWESGKGLDQHHNHVGYSVEECRNDPLWQEFSDLLPYMDQSASLSKIPPGKLMSPHVDRKWRPNAIYFPITGCSVNCISEYYDLPIADTNNSQSLGIWPRAAYTYSIVDNAVLTNVRLWHSVLNKSLYERTALGWNFLKASWTFDECKEILLDLGYADVQTTKT